MKFQQKTAPKLKLLFIGVTIPLILFSLLSNASANPSLNTCTCHESGSYRIHSNNLTQISVFANESFTLDFDAIGYNVSLRFRTEAQDNVYFECFSNQSILDNSIEDTNSSLNGVSGIFIFKAPATEGNYTLLIFAQSPDTPKPLIVCLEFIVSVGNEPAFSIDIFDHMNIYIGGSAIFLICFGTLLYETKRERTKVHAWFTTGSLCLTSINFILIWNPTIYLITSWIAYPNFIDYWNLFHMIIGLIGLIAGIMAFFTGLAGFRTKKPGYIAMICWTYCFLSGIIQWGIGI